MFENLIAEIVGLFYWLANIIICSTLRLKVINLEAVNTVHRQGKQIIFASWHGQFFPGAYFFRRWKMCILPITSLRGQIIASLGRKYGYCIIPYPEFGTPGERIQSAQRVLRTIKDGYNLALAVDGPPQPLYHKVNPGVLYFAQKTGYPLIPVGFHIERKMTMFWRWDKYEIPLPFSRMAIALGEPLMVPADLEVVELKKTTRNLEEQLHKTSEIARQTLELH